MIHPLTEERIIIDADSRKISVPKQLAAVGVCGDTNAETVYIYCPRYFDNIDWYNKTCLIRYINAGNEYGEYAVSDISIDSADNNMIIIGWTIQSPVTAYTGAVSFTLQFEAQTDGDLIYQWQTQPATIKILAGINGVVGTTGTASTNTYESLISRISAIESSIASLDLTSAMSTVNTFASRLQDTIDRLEYLEDHVVYLTVPSSIHPSDITYNISVINFADSTLIATKTLAYGDTYQIHVKDSSGSPVIGDITYSSTSTHVYVNNAGLVSLKFTAGMDEVINATIYVNIA